MEAENVIDCFLYGDDPIYGTANGLLIDKYIKHKKRVYKKIHTDNVRKVIIPDDIKEFSLLGNQNFKEFNQYVEDFINKLLQTYPKDYLGNLNNNVRTLKISRKRKSSSFYLINYYRVHGNRIAIASDKSTYHELMHMASTNLDNGNCGFNMGSVGVGLNEGYTELLTARLFYDGKFGVYAFLCDVTETLEKVIGPKMTELYFKADLLGLVKELKKYSSEEEITDFIHNTDILCNIILKTMNFIISDKKQREESAYYIINIYNYLTKIYMLKLKEDFENHTMTEDEYYRMQFEFLDNIRKCYVSRFDCNEVSWYHTTTYKLFDEIRKK